MRSSGGRPLRFGHRQNDPTFDGRLRVTVLSDRVAKPGRCGYRRVLHAQARTGWFARSRAAPPVQLRGRDREWPTAFPVVNSRVATPCTIPGPRERGCSEPRKCVAGLTDPRVCSVREGHHRGFLFWPDLLNSGYPGWRSALCMRSTSPWRSHDRVRSSGHHPCPRCTVAGLKLCCRSNPVHTSASPLIDAVRYKANEARRRAALLSAGKAQLVQG